VELFFSDNIEGGICRLSQEESAHCVKVLRHRCGDEISVIDGQGTLLRCRISDASPKETAAMVLSSEKNWGAHPYHLTLAVCPTKNIDRYEWMAEKLTEIGVDSIVPVIGERSERKVLKTERLRKILLSATKQSLKAAIPVMEEPLSVKSFISGADREALKLIAFCSEGERFSVKEVLREYSGDRIIALVGPEGDFSPSEIEQALAAGFRPVHLGPSRLRTETAGLLFAEAVYERYCL